jgi:hypothetical protein
MKGQWERRAPLIGVAFVVVLVISFILSGETPDADDSGKKVLAYYNDHDTRELVSGILGAYAVVLFLFFNGVLRKALRRAEGPDGGGLSTTAFAGGIFIAFGGALFSAFTFTLADTADDITPDAAQAINALNGDLFFPLAVGVSVFLISTALALLRTRLLPRWLAWVALVLGIVAVTPAGFFAFLAFLLWTLVASILLTLRGGAEQTATG